MKRTLKITLFRMWAAGAVCFFAAWGRGGSETAGAAFSLNLITSLIAIMVLGDLFIFTPVIRLAGGKRAFSYGEENIFPLFVSIPLQILKTAAIMLLIIYTYYFLNIMFIRILKTDETSVPVPLEPFLFGILYGLYYLIFEITGKAVYTNFFKKEKLINRGESADEYGK